MMEEATCKDQREPLGGKGGPQLAASKETRPQSYNHKELDYSNNQNVFESSKEHSPANTLILALRDSKQKTQLRQVVSGFPRTVR